MQTTPPQEENAKHGDFTNCISKAFCFHYIFFLILCDRLLCSFLILIHIFTYSTWKAFIVICSFYICWEYNLKNVTHIYSVYTFKHMLSYHLCSIGGNGTNLFMYSSKFVSNFLKIFFLV